MGISWNLLYDVPERIRGLSRERLASKLLLFLADAEDPDNKTAGDLIAKDRELQNQQDTGSIHMYQWEEGILIFRESREDFLKIQIVPRKKYQFFQESAYSAEIGGAMEKKTTEIRLYRRPQQVEMYGEEKEIIERFNHCAYTTEAEKKSVSASSLALCNEECELLYCRMPLKYVKPLDTFTYYTKGYTAYTDRAEEYWIWSVISCRQQKDRK